MQVQEYLREIEQECHVNVLFAVESGSRAWGIDSQDSDYDCRFIYMHEPDWYVSIGSPRDVIERFYEDRLIDISGWDIRKALFLLVKGNPSLYEWFRSPIIYRDEPEMEIVRKLSVQMENSVAARHHYLGLLQSTYKRYLKCDNVVLKKYLYAIRPALALNWLKEYGESPPIYVPAMRAGLSFSAELNETLDDLISKKKAGNEMSEGPRIPILHEFIENARDWAINAEPKKFTWNHPDRFEQANEALRALVRNSDV